MELGFTDGDEESSGAVRLLAFLDVVDSGLGLATELVRFSKPGVSYGALEVEAGPKIKGIGAYKAVGG